MQLAEKYRPKQWVEFVGQEKIIARVRTLVSRPQFGQGGGEAFALLGPTGTGKTTLAQLVARELGVAPGESWNYMELDGDKCDATTVRHLDSQTHSASMFADCWRVCIVNEAHAMTEKAVQAWLTLLERLPAKWLIVFTTTERADTDLFGRFTSPLLARCKVFEFTNQGLAQLMAARARVIAQSEGLDGQPESRYLRLVQDCHNSMREVLQRIDAGEMVTA